MVFRHKIEKLKRQKEHELRILEDKVSELRAYLQALDDTLKILPREGETANSTTVTDSLRAGGMLYNTRELMRKKGSPMHIDEILKALGKEVNLNTKRSLAGSLNTYVRRGQMFTRTGPNIFFLREFENKSDESEDDEK